MTELEKLRAEIDQTDKELIRQFVRRMEISRKIGEYKKPLSLPVRDAEREQAVIKRNAALCGEYGTYGEKLYRTIIELSCELQENLDD